MSQQEREDLRARLQWFGRRLLSVCAVTGIPLCEVCQFVQTGLMNDGRLLLLSLECNARVRSYGSKPFHIERGHCGKFNRTTFRWEL